jgi:hypothetical protein
VGESNRRLKKCITRSLTICTELNVVRAIRPKKDDIFGEYVEDNNIMNNKRM